MRQRECVFVTFLFSLGSLSPKKNSARPPNTILFHPRPSLIDAFLCLRLAPFPLCLRSERHALKFCPPFSFRLGVDCRFFSFLVSFDSVNVKRTLFLLWSLFQVCVCFDCFVFFSAGAS